MRQLFAIAALAASACSGGSGGDAPGLCDGHCADVATRLEVADVERVLAQAIVEAQARAMPATLAVVDRVGNVLAVFEMTGAASTVTTDGGNGVSEGLDGINAIPARLAAISKAITAAYLSSEGNAFTTRTASQIVQPHFNPGEVGQPAGPLFGVQFSQLACSDISARFGGSRPAVGPARSPLGLAADPGGLPLYKSGTPVGALGVVADGSYGIDPNVQDRDVDDDEVIALAGSFGFEAPADRRADRITVDGKPLRFADARPSDQLSDPATAPAFASLDGSAGTRLAVTGYMGDSAIVAGTAFGQPESGIRPATGALGALDGFVLVDAGNAERYAPVAGGDGAAIGPANVLSGSEVSQLLESALAVANRARAQIRRPLASPARVSIAVVDTFGEVLGLVRSRDAPVFGTDVAVQKARTAAFFSNAAAASDLQATAPANYFNGGSSAISDYVTAVRNFLDRPTALGDGAIAFTDRAGGNLSRPYFPDGVPGVPHGPFSKAFAAWSPFSTGLQLDLVNNAILEHVTHVINNGVPADVAAGACTGLPPPAGGANRLPNGIQIFPGSVPIYRGSTLVGGIGISGDGVDQDDMISFLGLHEAGVSLGTIGNAPAAMRADTLQPQGVRLRYVQCPQAPYNGSDAQNVCEGK